jgi:hypothetical protein
MGQTVVAYLVRQERLGRGEFNPATTRVLHFVHNPEAEARREAEAARITQLEAEAAALRAQLDVLHRSNADEGAAGEPLTAATAIAAAERTLLERKAWPN